MHGLYHNSGGDAERDYYSEMNCENCGNKFDETCQGTVPVALDIISQSNSFEDAIRMGTLTKEGINRQSLRS